MFAVLLCGTVTRSLERNYETVTSVANWLSGITTKVFGEKIMNTTLEQATSNSFEGSIVSMLLVKIVLSIKQSSSIPTNVTINQIISPILAYYIVCIISLISIYFIFKMIFYVIADMTKILHKFKLTGNFDKTLGATFGFIKALVLIDIILLCVGAIPIRLTQTITVNVEKSMLVSFLQDLNFIRIIFEAVFSNGATKFISGLF